MDTGRRESKSAPQMLISMEMKCWEMLLSRCFRMDVEAMAQCSKGLLRDSGILAGGFFMFSCTAGAGAYAAVITNNIPRGNIRLQ